MPAYRLPASYIARQHLKLLDEVYEPGDEIPGHIIKELQTASALLSSRQIIPMPDPHYRRTMPERGTPTDVPAQVRVMISDEETEPDPEPEPDPEEPPEEDPPPDDPEVP